MKFEMGYRKNYTGYNILHNNTTYDLIILIMCSFLIHEMIVFVGSVTSCPVWKHLIIS